MGNHSTVFLKIVVAFLGVVVCALSIFWLPGMSAENIKTNADTSHLHYPFLLYIYSGTIPFYIGLLQAFKVLRYIDTNRAFSELSVRALRTIKYCASVIVGILACGVLFAIFGLDGDRSHVIAIGGSTLFASIVVAAFAALLEKLLQHAVAIKSENDLTV